MDEYDLSTDVSDNGLLVNKHNKLVVCCLCTVLYGQWFGLSTVSIHMFPFIVFIFSGLLSRLNYISVTCFATYVIHVQIMCGYVYIPLSFLTVNQTA